MVGTASASTSKTRNAPGLGPILSSLRFATNNPPHPLTAFPWDDSLARAYHFRFASMHWYPAISLQRSGSFLLKPGNRGNKFIARYGARHEREEFSEVMGEAWLHFVHGDVAGEKLFKRCGFATRDATGNNQIEIAQVRRNVVGKAVGGDPAAKVHADGGEFFFSGIALRVGIDPNARFPGNAEGCKAK